MQGARVACRRRRDVQQKFTPRNPPAGVVNGPPSIHRLVHHRHGIDPPCAGLSAPGSTPPRLTAAVPMPAYNCSAARDSAAPSLRARAAARDAHSIGVGCAAQGRQEEEAGRASQAGKGRQGGAEQAQQRPRKALLEKRHREGDGWYSSPLTLSSQRSPD